ncbi:hypothetical protein HDU96_007306 [Phlyctochytrium bullatum]|nr:hypothetical protein HDU96_007306 [Phlyctochytrium bullatum]
MEVRGEAQAPGAGMKVLRMPMATTASLATRTRPDPKEPWTIADAGGVVVAMPSNGSGGVTSGLTSAGKDESTAADVAPAGLIQHLLAESRVIREVDLDPAIVKFLLGE